MKKRLTVWHWVFAILFVILLALAVIVPMAEGAEANMVTVWLSGDAIIEVFPEAGHDCDEVYARSWYTSPSRPDGAWTNWISWSGCVSRVESIRPGGVRLHYVEFWSVIYFDVGVSRLMYLPVMG